MAQQSWDLKKLFEKTNADIEDKLTSLRNVVANNSFKGSALEIVWRDLLIKYLPKRYNVTTGFVIDGKNNASKQIDILIYDKQYSPPVFTEVGVDVIPAESVYAAFEVKPDMDPVTIRYARQNIQSVKKLKRTSVAFDDAGELKDAKKAKDIIGGILTLGPKNTEDNSEKFKNRMLGALNPHDSSNRLDLGCAASSCYFKFNKGKNSFDGDIVDNYDIHLVNKPVVQFLFKLITELQVVGTAPAIDLGLYAKFLD